MPQAGPTELNWLNIFFDSVRVRTEDRNQFLSM